MSDPIDAAFIKEVNQNLGIPHKICRIYFPVDEREDVVQEMMYQLWRSYPKFNRGSKFTTWMYSVCLNTALTYRRKISKRRTESLSAHHYQISETPWENREERISALFDAIATLSPLNRAIILLYLENLKYEEIAEITGLSKTNVSVKLVRIKKELEKLLKNKIKTI